MDTNKYPLKLPDIKRMLAVEGRITETYHGETGLLAPAVRERIGDLCELVRRGSDVLRAKVVTALVAIKEQLLDAQSDVGSELEEELLRTRSKLQFDMAKASGAIQDVDRYRLPETAAQQRQLQETIDIQTSAINELEEALKAQQQQVHELNEIMALLEKPSVSKALKGLIPEEKDIDVILGTIKDPSVNAELLKAGIRKLNKNLEELASARKFADLVKTRERLVKRAKDQQKSLSDVKALLASNQETVGQYARLDELNTLRNQWLEEAGKFTTSWKSLEQAMVATLEHGELIAGFERVHGYMLDVRRQFEAA